MSDPWYATLCLIGSHILVIPSIVIAYRKRLPIPFIQLTFTFIISILYHLCKSINVCLLGGTLLSWTQLDYIYAFGTILVVFILIAITTPILAEYGLGMAPHQTFWSIVIIMALLALDIVIVLTRLQSLAVPLDHNTAFIIIVASAAAVMVKIVLVDEGHMPFYSKYDGFYLMLSLILLAAGVIFFLLDIPDDYWFYHSMWHAFAFSGLFFLILGTTKNIPAHGHHRA